MKEADAEKLEVPTEERRTMGEVGRRGETSFFVFREGAPCIYSARKEVSEKLGACKE